MKKIPTIFERNFKNMRELLPIANESCLWVFAGEGVATRKYDGTCVKIDGVGYFKRREVKAGKNSPVGFEEEHFDNNTGKRVGWVPVNPTAKEDQWHREAFCVGLSDGTYELVGPKVQGNPEKFEKHTLIRHSEAEILDAPRTYDTLKEWLKDRDIEGIVFHHPDGRMGKIKKKDFGQKRK